MLKKNAFAFRDIDVLVWNSHVVMLWGGTERDWRKRFTHFWVPTKVQDHWSAYLPKLLPRQACTMECDEAPWTYFVWIHPSTKDRSELAGAIAHELQHVVVRLLRRKGVVLTPESEEAYTYLLEYLTRETWKWAWGRKG